MLILKEGLTDPHEEVRYACYEFLGQTLKECENDYSKFFCFIDCKTMYIKEYFV
jgi:hypothetical protein